MPNGKFEQMPIPSAEKPPEIEEKEAKEKMEYDPIVSIRRDFSPEWIHQDPEKNWEAVIDDPDLKQIMNFYRREAKKGTLLDLGAGSTHLHYMSAMEDKLSHITALDLSEKNLRVLQEFLDAVGPEAVVKKAERQHISDEDISVLRTTAEAREKIAHRKDPRPEFEVLQSIRKKSLTKEGEYDFIAGNMHDLSKLEERKFDNIMLGFSLFANKEEEIPKLFQQIKEHLNPGGKVFIADFQGFSAENLKEEFSEDKIVLERYPNAIDLSLPLLVSSLEKAGFSKDAIKARVADTHSEGEKDFKYLFVNAEKEDKAEARKAAAAQTREKTKAWKEHFGPLTELWTPAMRKETKKLEEEKKSVETAKIPEKGIKPEEILKEAGIEKPAESFEEAQKRLAEKFKDVKTQEDKLLAERNFYLGELGYSVKYKGLLLDKVEIRDENDKPLGEFKSFYFSKTERQANDFLKERLREKFASKPAAEKTEEEKLEAGFQKTIKTAEQEQGRRVEKISSLQDVKEVGRGRLEKLMGGLSYIAAMDKLGILGLRSGKKLAVEGGKDLAVIGLTPLAALEQAGHKIRGEFQLSQARRERASIEKRITFFEQKLRFKNYVEFLREESQQASGKMIKAQEAIYKKRGILRLIEILGGKLSKPVAEKLYG